MYKIDLNKISIKLIKAKINHVIKKDCVIIKAEYEDLALQDMAKGIMFKLKKQFDKEWDNLSKMGFKIDRKSTKIKPYNNGFELKVECRIDWRNLSNEMGRLIVPLDLNTLHIHPEAFFQENIDEKKGDARISFNNFNMKGKEQYTDVKVKNKKDIKKALDKYYKENVDRIKAVMKSIRDLNNKEKSQKQKDKDKGKK